MHPMETIIILSEKKWHQNLYKDLKLLQPNFKWIWISDQNDFIKENLDKIKPLKIFIPHWSYYIPKNIYQNYECIVFHMTDLPFGRGGSPLQNLILSGKKNTKISAILVEGGLDTGDIYLKKDLPLNGTAQEIFLRSVPIIKEMINEILDRNLKPYSQKGEITLFKRRTPDMSDVSNITELEKLYDIIRMLDCEGYPNAFIETNNLRFEFNKVEKNKNELIANVRILKK
jgi:methionyl-tRNA formyltransferase